MTDSVHQELADDVGFKVEGLQILYGDRPRPASQEECRLWSRAVQAKAAFKQSQKERAALEADKASLEASCEAYREQLQKLHDFLAHEFPIQPTDDCIEYAMDRLVESYKHVCEPNPQRRTLLQQLDAHKVADSFGTPANPTVGER